MKPSKNKKNKSCEIPDCPYEHKPDGSPVLTYKKKITKKTRKVKAWAILNSENNCIWGMGGIGVHPIEIYSLKSRAEFTRDSLYHVEEVRKGNTKIVRVEISYQVDI